MTINDTVEVNGNVTLILPDDVTLTVPKGIHVNPGATLSVYGQEKGTGKLIATGGYKVTGSNYIATAGIGGIYKRYTTESSYTYENYGTIKIYGGNIEAKGSPDLPTAGIGGASGTVKIFGGTVNATGSVGQYGIDGTTVNIEGGTVTATGGNGGGGYPNGIHGKNISITGGNVKAVGKGNYGIYSTSHITLAWTNYSDTITSNGIYVQGEVTQNNYFYMNDTQTEAQWQRLSTSNQWAIGDSASTFTLKPIGDKTVTVDMNGGNEIGYSFNIEYSETITEPATPTRDGYIFDGWYVNNQKCTFPYTVTADVTLTAKWKVPYLTADGTTAYVNAENVTDITAETTTLTNSWYKVTGNVEISNTVTASGDVNIILCDGAVFSVEQIINNFTNLTIYAQSQSENAGTISAEAGILGNTVTVNGGTINGNIDAYNEITVKCGNIIGNLFSQEQVNINGGTINGEISSLDQININGGNITGNINAGNEITVNGGNINAGQIAGYPINIKLKDRNDSVKAESYIGSVTLNGDYAGTKDNQLAYAYWNSEDDNNINGATLTRSNKCTVTFNSNGGSSVASQNIVEGMKISCPENPTKSEAVFAGWLLNGQPYDFDTVHNFFTGNITLTAKWIPFAKYLDTNGQLVTKADANELSSDSYVWGEWGQETWYAVNETVDIPQNVTVQGDVHLILRSNSVLNAKCGITVNTPANLTIYADSTDENTMGVLNATGAAMSYGADSNMSGIGGYYNGTVTINGGKITATGGKGGPGIGGNYDSGNVIINGGIVTATGSNGGAGIGGCPNETGSVTINGGVVTATGSGYITDTNDYIGGAGIGGSASQSSGMITINGGTVTASGSFSSSDIGCGSASFNNITDNDIVIINGGNITAKGNGSFGIGSCNGSNVSIPVSLSWSKDQNTKIEARSYNAVISLDREYLFKFDGDDSTAVTTGNLNGKTLVPKEYTLIPRYTVNFYKNIPGIAEAELYTSQTVYQGDTIQTPEIDDQYITYDGDETETEYQYHFIGWKDADGNAFDNASITKDTDLYADWTYIKDGTEHYLVRVIANPLMIGENGEVTCEANGAISIAMQDSDENTSSGQESSSSDTTDTTDTTDQPSDQSGSTEEEETPENEYVYVSGEWCAWLPAGKKVTLSVIPAEDKSVTGVFANGMPMEEEFDNEYSFTVSDHHVTVTAAFGTGTYTVKWINYDNKVLKKVNVDCGAEHPVYDGATPARAADAQYTYTFTGWNQESPAVVTGNITYTAQFRETLNSYTVTWEDADGSTVETDNAEYGTIPTFDGNITIPEGTSLYWTDGTNAYSNDDLPDVTGDVTYRALFVKPIAVGTVFYESDTVDFGNYYINHDDYNNSINAQNGYGLMIIGEPIYHSDWKQYRIQSNNGAVIAYITSTTDLGENIGIKVVSGDGSYYNPFTFRAVRYCTVTWKDTDGTVLETDKAEYGTMPVYSGTIPTAPEGYHFAGWTPAISEVTGDVEYTAVYSDKYTVTWDYNNGTTATATEQYAENSKVVPRTPSKEGYVFAGWYLGDTLYDFGTPVTADITLTAHWIADSDVKPLAVGQIFCQGDAADFAGKYYTNYYNSDCNLNVIVIGEPEYNGGTYRISDVNDASKEFWVSSENYNANVGIIVKGGDGTENNPFTFGIVIPDRKYTVTWSNEHGIIETDTDVMFGMTPKFDGNITVPDGKVLCWTDGTNTYTNDNMPTVTDNVSYTAVFSEVKSLAVGQIFRQGDLVDFGNCYIVMGDVVKVCSGIIPIISIEYITEGGYGLYAVNFDSAKQAVLLIVSSDNLGENVGIKVIGGQGTRENPFVFAAHSENSHIISFFIEGYETPFRVQTVADGNTFADNSFHSMSASQKDKYWEFLGWYTENDEKYDFSRPVTADISLHEKWAEKTVEIQFKGFNGKDKNTVSVSPVNESFSGEDINSLISTNIPSASYLDGYNFTGWTLNDTAYGANEQEGLITALAARVAAIPDEPIIVNEVYEHKNEEYTVTVNNGKIKDGEATGTFNPSAQVYVTATGGAPDQIFSHWEKDGVTVGYEETYAFRMPSFNTTLTAVYKTIPEEKAGTAYIENVTVHDVNKISFVSIVSVPKGSRILKAGIVAAKESDLNDRELTKDTAQFTRYDGTSCYNYLSFKYTWTKSNVSADDTWCVRSYLEYKDENNTVHTIYSDETTKAKLS